MFRLPAASFMVNPGKKGDDVAAIR